MPVRRGQCSKSRRVLIVLVNLLVLAIGVFPHLRPDEEMPHRLLDHVKGIEHLIGIPSADVLLRLLKESALVSRALGPSHDISSPERRGSSIGSADGYDIFHVFKITEMTHESGTLMDELCSDPTCFTCAATS